MDVGVIIKRIKSAWRHCGLLSILKNDKGARLSHFYMIVQEFIAKYTVYKNKYEIIYDSISFMKSVKVCKIWWIRCDWEMGQICLSIDSKARLIKVHREIFWNL
jgi:hypothetical protein